MTGLNDNWEAEFDKTFAGHPLGTVVLAKAFIRSIEAAAVKRTRTEVWNEVNTLILNGMKETEHIESRLGGEHET